MNTNTDAANRYAVHIGDVWVFFFILKKASSGVCVRSRILQDKRKKKKSHESMMSILSCGAWKDGLWKLVGRVARFDPNCNSKTTKRFETRPKIWGVGKKFDVLFLFFPQLLARKWVFSGHTHFWCVQCADFIHDHMATRIAGQRPCAGIWFELNLIARYLVIVTSLRKLRLTNGISKDQWAWSGWSRSQNKAVIYMQIYMLLIVQIKKKLKVIDYNLGFALLALQAWRLSASLQALTKHLQYSAKSSRITHSEREPALYSGWQLSF